MSVWRTVINERTSPTIRKRGRNLNFFRFNDEISCTCVITYRELSYLLFINALLFLSYQSIPKSFKNWKNHTLYKKNLFFPKKSCIYVKNIYISHQNPNHQRIIFVGHHVLLKFWYTNQYFSHQRWCLIHQQYACKGIRKCVLTDRREK